MTTEHGADLAVTTGERDPELNDRLAEELTAFNSAATGASDRGTISVKLADSTGELVGAYSLDVGWPPLRYRHAVGP